MSVSVVKSWRRVAPLTGGVIVMNGSEQTVVEYIGMGRVMGYLDLTSMASGDTIVIRQYVRLRRDGGYKRYAEETYSGAQPDPVVYVKPKESNYGIKITLQQTAGTFKLIEYNFLKEE